MIYNLITPATALPVSLTDTKLHIGVTNSDHDAMITSLIWGAVRQFENRANECLTAQTWDLTLNQAEVLERVEFYKYPVSSITSVSYYDGDDSADTVSSDDYTLFTNGKPASIIFDDVPTTYDRDDSMTIRFVAVAYGVPQEYLFAELGIPFEHRNSNDSLAHLNRKYEFGRPSEDYQPPILAEVQEAILKYQADPVATGLVEDVRPWMSVRYIANSTGIPEEYIFAQIGIPLEGNEGKPLERLDHEFDYGGRREIVEAVKQTLTQYGDDQ